MKVEKVAAVLAAAAAAAAAVAPRWPAYRRRVEVLVGQSIDHSSTAGYLQIHLWGMCHSLVFQPGTLVT
jgi:hypothetical protein